MTGKIENHYKGYVQSEIRLAKELHESEMLYSEIAAKMGRTETAIKDLYRRLGLRRMRQRKDKGIRRMKND